MPELRRSRVIHDAAAARVDEVHVVDCKVFGFEKEGVETNPDGTVARAELVFANGLFLVKPTGDAHGVDNGSTAWGTLLRRVALTAGDTPQGQDASGGLHELTGPQPTATSLICFDFEPIYSRARAAGAVIWHGSDMGTGGQGFTARDPEGQLWYVYERTKAAEPSFGMPEFAPDEPS